MVEQLRLYAQRKLGQFIQAVGSEDPSQEFMFIALKFLVTDSSALTDFRHHPLALRMQTLENKLDTLEKDR